MSEKAPGVVPISLAPDPVIEAYKRDVDRTLIRENLRLTPEQRLLKMISVAKFHEQLRQAAREAWKK